MYCPNCGLEENQQTPYCRSCGSDLDAIRNAALGPRTSDPTYADPRSEIAFALKQKIESIGSAKELRKSVTKLLPEVEKLLESPQEKRLKRIRSGSIVAMVGFGAAIGFFLAALFGDPDVIVISALGFVAMFVGFALVLNGYFFSETGDADVVISPGGMDRFQETGRDTSELLMPPDRSRFSSVTENTTRTLDEKLPVSRKE